MSSKALSRLSVALLFGLVASLPALADSHVRIVRLSYIEGSVQIDRGAGQFEKAIVNLPITEGVKLRTGNDGRAEVEFEDGSTLRIVPDSAFRFTRLSLQDSGEKVSNTEVIRGTVYVNFLGTKDSQLTVQFGRESVTLTRAAHLRIGLDDTGAAVAVFKGETQVDAPSGVVELKKKQTAEFDSAQDDRAIIAKNIQDEPEDAWDKQQEQYHLRYASNSYSSYSPYAYGSSDLVYYGNFFSAPGYGMLWRPYFAGLGWDPFMCGAWAFHPGWGYGWVSAYPWGWVPYHYGTWVFVGGFGWAWQPGGVWMPWYAQPRVLNPPSGFAPPRAPLSGGTIVVVNRGPSPIATPRSGSKLVIRNDSAGLGIPRGEISNLAKVSQQVQQKGAVTQRINTPPITPAPALWGNREMPRGAGPGQTGGSAAGRGRTGGNSAEMDGMSRGGQGSRSSEPRSMPSPGTSSSHASTPPAPPRK